MDEYIMPSDRSHTQKATSVPKKAEAQGDKTGLDVGVDHQEARGNFRGNQIVPGLDAAASYMSVCVFKTHWKVH